MSSPIHNNPHSPHHQFKSSVQHAMKAHDLRFDDYCYFIPFFGLGDKLTYLSFLPHLRAQGMRICILASHGDPFVFLYREVADLLLFVQRTDLQPFQHADNAVGPGQICAMWHVPYFGGCLQKASGPTGRDGIYDRVVGGHKLAVKLSLQLDMTLQPQFPQALTSLATAAKEDYVYISPIANSTKSMAPSLLASILDLLRSRSVRCVVNVANRDQVSSAYTLPDWVDKFTGNVQDAISIAGRARLSINTRSGMSEVHAAMGLDFIDIYPDDNLRIPFWSLAAEFARAPLEEIHDPTDTLAALQAWLQ
ncbi:MAG: hypothetical protein QE285_16545 [Aquabacterium sp.]|nr:hypothetical protein [Aquabacterium sp.]